MAQPVGGGGGGGDGPFTVFGAPKKGGAAKAIWLGALVMIASFFVKQVMVDLSLYSVSGGMEESRLQLAQRVANFEIDEELDELKDKLSDLELDAPKMPDDPDDMEKYQDKMKDHDEAELGCDVTFPKGFDAWYDRCVHDEDVKDLKEKIADKEDDLKDKRKEIVKEYRPKIRDAGRSAKAAEASGIGRFQWTIYLKLFLDLLKVLGGALVVFGGLAINLDEEASTGAKAYAAVLGGVAFLSIVLGGLWTLIA